MFNGKIFTFLLLVVSSTLALGNERNHILTPPKSNSSPFPGVDMTYGYIDLNNNSDDKIFYTFTKNKSGKTDAPVLIINPGGPGAGTSSVLTYPRGPLQYSKDKGTLISNPKPNFTDNCDLLLPDIISGSGFSTSNINVDFTKSPEKIFAETADFFIKLNEQRPELKLKQRNLIFYGISHGTALFPWIAKFLSEKGFKIAGVIMDSPFVSPYHMFQKWSEEVKKANAIPEGNKTYDHYSAIAETCAGLVKNKENWTLGLGIYCAQLWDDPTARPFINPETNDFVSNGYDLRMDPLKNRWTSRLHGEISEDVKNFWETENSKKTFNTLKEFKSFDENVNAYQYLAHMDFSQTLDAFDYQCNKGINIMIMVGKWDGITGPIITKAWMEDSICINKMNIGKWENTNRGKQMRYGNNIEYEIYEEASHFVGMGEPEAMLAKINEMVSKIGKSLND